MSEKEMWTQTAKVSAWKKRVWVSQICRVIRLRCTGTELSPGWIGLESVYMRVPETPGYRSYRISRACNHGVLKIDRRKKAWRRDGASWWNVSWACHEGFQVVLRTTLFQFTRWYASTTSSSDGTVTMGIYGIWQRQRQCGWWMKKFTRLSDCPLVKLLLACMMIWLVWVEKTMMVGDLMSSVTFESGAVEGMESHQFLQSCQRQVGLTRVFWGAWRSIGYTVHRCQAVDHRHRYAKNKVMQRGMCMNLNQRCHGQMRYEVVVGYWMIWLK